MSWWEGVGPDAMHGVGEDEGPPYRHPFGYAHPVWKTDPHAFVLCCIAANNRRVCRCGMSERNEHMHPPELQP